MLGRQAKPDLLPDKATDETEDTVGTCAYRKSYAGSQYFVTFIDDHIQKLWASPLKTKDQVLSVFKEFHARVERETGRKLKAV